jgi:acyl-coenzyme A thioesterase PaaI-like protein
MKQQPSSQMCFACGRENPVGLHLTFVEDDGQVVTSFTPGEEHQGFPGILHGGIISTLLDETIGRALLALNLWAVTAQLDISFRAPVPIGRPVTISGRIVEFGKRKFKGLGELRLEDGTVAAEASALYVRMPEARKDEIAHRLGLDSLADPDGDISGFWEAS